MSDSLPPTRMVSAHQLQELLGEESAPEDAATKLYRRGTRASAPKTVVQVRAPIASVPSSSARGRRPSRVRAGLWIGIASVLACLVAAFAVLQLARGQEQAEPREASKTFARESETRGGAMARPHASAAQGSEAKAPLAPSESAEAASSSPQDRPVVLRSVSSGALHAALDALASGDSALARDRYRALAQQTQRPVFERFARVLDWQLACQSSSEAPECED